METEPIDKYREFFKKRKVLILDTSLSYFRITTGVKVRVKKSSIGQMLLE